MSLHPLPVELLTSLPETLTTSTGHVYATLLIAAGLAQVCRYLIDNFQIEWIFPNARTR